MDRSSPAGASARGSTDAETERVCAISCTHARGVCTGSDVLFATADLRSRGFSRRAIAAAVAHGDLVAVRRGVYARPEVCRTYLTAVAHGGVPGCVSAARHRGLWVLEDSDVSHVWLPARHQYAHPGCACRTHSDELAAVSRFALPRVPQILRQILGCRGVEEFFVALESALRQSMLTSDELAWLRVHVTAEARTAMDLARADADSGLESLLRWRLRHLGLDIRTQVRVAGVGVVDALIGDRLLIEVDGRAGHVGVAERHKDLMRDATAAIWGYRTLRFDYAMVVHDWDVVEAAILGQLAALGS